MIIPAILSADRDDLETKLAIIKPATDWVQIDITDGQFVDTTSVTLVELPAAIFMGVAVEAHLMVATPEHYIADCQRLGVQRVIFHVETHGDIAATLEKIKAANMECGLALNPETDIEQVAPYINQVDLVTLLAVTPGRQGQAFDQKVIKKIQQLGKKAPDLTIEVDGGLNQTTIPEVISTGAKYCVVGSAIFQAPEPIQALHELVGLTKTTL